MDGANAGQRIFQIIIPLMKPTLMLTLIVNAISVFKMSTEPNMLLTGWISTPDYVATPLNIVLTNIKGGSYGMASAAGWILFVIILILTVIQYRFLEDPAA